MKTSLLLLSLLSTSAFASDVDKLQKNLSNPELYKQHHIKIIKEEKRHFLFFPYTKQVVMNDVKLSGTDVVMSNQLETPYISSVTRNDNNQTVINNDSLKTGLFIDIKTIENTNQQILSVNQSEVVKLDKFISPLHTNESEDETSYNEEYTIQLPSVQSSSFSNPINTNHFEKTWKDSSGATYKLIYTGEKNLAKS